MVLKRGDIASFVANWRDKPANLRAIAEELNIGLDALVFVDDNPFERDLVRRELPMVAVPEISDDPTSYAQTLADAGYFEAVAITDEDRARSGQYQSNRAARRAEGVGDRSRRAICAGWRCGCCGGASTGSGSRASCS